jgi:transcription-repair coupling factor (superfamily II helicase)
MPQPSKLRLTNLAGSSSQFIFSAVYSHPSAAKLNHLVILDNAEEAAYFHNTLENLTEALDLYYFPSSFKNRKNFRLLNSSHSMLRTEALTRFSADGNKRILVGYPEAIFEKVVLPKTLSRHLIRVKTNDTLDVNALMEQFVSYGFERTDFVYEPGQFAMRGGILDIYSYGNDKPYRLELFGNEVDSIRIFDPETQLSERKLMQVTIIPNVETQFDNEDKISLLEFLPENTVVWLKDKDVLREALLTQEEDLELFLLRNPDSGDTIEEEGIEKTVIREEDFVKASVLEELLYQRTVIEFGQETGGNARSFPESDVFAFKTRQQPSFNRQFDILIRDLVSYDRKKHGIFLFAENPKQLERLHSIFTDLKAEISFTPVPVAIHEGFIDDEMQVVCYTRSSRRIIRTKP